MKKLFFLMLVLFVLCGLMICSCGNNSEKNDDEGPVQPVETVSEEDAIDLSNYLILRSDDASPDLKEAIVELRMAIQEKCGYLLDLKTDFSGEANLEIVIGKTKRGGVGELNQAEYIIKHTAKGFLIAGGSDTATKAAMNFFAEHLLSPSGALCAPDFDYAVDNSVKIGGKSYDEIKIYLGFYDKTCNPVIVDKLLNMGVPTSVVKDEAEANIVFTSDADAKLTTIPADNWGVTVENDILYVVGRNEYEEISVRKYVAEYFSTSTGKFVFKEGAMKAEKFETKEEFYAKKNLTIYPEFPDRIGRDYLYSVSVTQGDTTASIPVYNHCQDNPYWVRDNVGGDNWRRFSIFAFSGEQVRVDVKVGCDFESYVVMPSAKGLKNEFKDGVISVWLDKPEYFMIRLNDDNNTIISILPDYPEYPLDIPEKDNPDVMWISGVVEPETGEIYLTEDNQTIYIEPGAVLFSRVKLVGNDCKILGRGAMVDPYENFYKLNPEGKNEGSGVKFVETTGENSLFDGPVLLDAHCFNFHIRKGSVYNGKALSTMLTSDGLQLVTNCYAERCFVYVGDNGFVFSGDNVQYKDITVGSTCAAIFPQGCTSNCKLENIYVFRSDGGLINNRYNGGPGIGSENWHGVDINGLYADDCTKMSWFFQGQKMGRIEKVFNLTNVTTCSTTGVEDFYAKHTDAFILFQTTESALYTDNYTLNIKNLYVDGKLIKDVSQLNVHTTMANIIPYNEINITYDDTKVITRKNVEVNYTRALNVYIGEFQPFFKNPVISEGEKIYLPADEIMGFLRVSGKPTTTDKNGVAYVEAKELVSKGLVAKAEKSGNRLTLTPVYNGENLLLPDKGDIPYFIEAISYREDMTAKVVNGETIYSIFNAAETGAGALRCVTDEVKMYGNGKYVLEFEIKGTGNAMVQYGCLTSSRSIVKKEHFDITDAWKKVTCEIDINEDLSDLKSYFINIATSNRLTNAFDVKNIKLTKVK